jgi:hypothetical protein
MRHEHSIALGTSIRLSLIIRARGSQRMPFLHISSRCNQFHFPTNIKMVSTLSRFVKCHFFRSRRAKLKLHDLPTDILRIILEQVRHQTRIAAAHLSSRSIAAPQKSHVVQSRLPCMSRPMRTPPLPHHQLRPLDHAPKYSFQTLATWPSTHKAYAASNRIIDVRLDGNHHTCFGHLLGSGTKALSLARVPLQPPPRSSSLPLPYQHAFRSATPGKLARHCFA